MKSRKARLRQNLVLSGTSSKFKITRGATLIHGLTRALGGIPSYSRQLTYDVTEYLIPENIFPCALCGPFDKLPLDPALTLPDSLCAHEYLYLRFNGLVV